MIAVSLSKPGGNFGWSVASENIIRELKKLDTVVEATDGDDYPMALEVPMLHAIQGVNLLPLRPNWWSNAKNIGYAFIEDSLLVQKYAMNAARYFDHVVAGSSWCQEILNQAGVIDTSVIIQGIAPEYFEVPPRKEDGKFIVFSGGKLERRKSQDVVAKAMKVMMDRHKDVYLCCAWNNPWKCGDFEKVKAEIDACELPRDRVFGPGYTVMNHSRMKDVYANCDIGLFPNRCEAGNNMILSEFMACGKPALATHASGHKDVLHPDDPLNLTANKPLKTPTAVWVEPDLDEVISRLEWAYDRMGYPLSLYGAVNRQRMRQFTWEACAKQFYDILIKT